MNVRLRAASAVAALCAVGALSACTGSDAVNPGKGNGDGFRFHSANSKGSLIKVADRKSAENFDGTLLDGGTYKLSSDQGKIVVVNFWATWCGPCTIETPQLNDVYEAYKSKPVTFVGIDTKETNEDAPRSFVKDNKIAFPIVFDEQGKTALQLGNLPAQAMPFTVIVDKSHRVAAVYVGRVTPNDLEPVLDTLTAEH